MMVIKHMNDCYLCTKVQNMMWFLISYVKVIVPTAT